VVRKPVGDLRFADLGDPIPGGSITRGFWDNILGPVAFSLSIGSVIILPVVSPGVYWDGVVLPLDGLQVVVDGEVLTVSFSDLQGPLEILAGQQIEIEAYLNLLAVHGVEVNLGIGSLTAQDLLGPTWTQVTLAEVLSININGLQGSLEMLGTQALMLIVDGGLLPLAGLEVATDGELLSVMGSISGLLDLLPSSGMATGVSDLLPMTGPEGESLLTLLPVNPSLQLTGDLLSANDFRLQWANLLNVDQVHPSLAGELLNTVPTASGLSEVLPVAPFLPESDELLSVDGLALQPDSPLLSVTPSGLRGGELLSVIPLATNGRELLSVIPLATNGEELLSVQLAGAGEPLAVQVDQLSVAPNDLVSVIPTATTFGQLLAVQPAGTDVGELLSVQVDQLSTTPAELLSVVGGNIQQVAGALQVDALSMQWGNLLGVDQFTSILEGETLPVNNLGSVLAQPLPVVSSETTSAEVLPPGEAVLSSSVDGSLPTSGVEVSSGGVLGTSGIQVSSGGVLGTSGIQVSSGDVLGTSGVEVSSGNPVAVDGIQVSLIEPWILADGRWNDLGAWDDFATWRDNP